jgi:ATP-dependent RNA helicase DDX23/PRP28
MFDYDYEAEDTSGGANYNEAFSMNLFADTHESKPSSNYAHWSKKLTKEITDRDWKIFKEDYQVFVTGGKGPNPFRSWSESGLPRDLLDAIYKAGYTKPTPIQMQAIPIAMIPKDLVGISSTGSGKTAAFVLPMLFYIKQLPAVTPLIAQDGPYALILAPSRELALQIEQEASKFSSFCRMKICSIVGGRSAEQQTLTLSQGVEMVVATPGRLADSLDAKQTVLNQCFYVVLDEADKMVDLGFEPFLTRILDSIPTGPKRITQMFSATMPVSVERLTRRYLVNPLTVTVGDFDGGLAKSNIEQRLQFTQTDMDKKRYMFDIIANTEFPVIVFVNSKRAADQVGLWLDNAGYRVMVLHSGKVQQKREDAINQFKSKDADILVATDVAGRGIDVPDVKHVVNFDMPKNIEDYTHRIGRTGRAGKSGIATSLITPFDEEVLPELKKFLISAKQFVPEELDRVSIPSGIDEGMNPKRKRDGTVYAI